MAKVKLEFDFFEERSEYTDALNGTNWKIVAQSMSEYFRRKLKYETLSRAERKIYEESQKELLSFVEHHGLSFS